MKTKVFTSYMLDATFTLYIQYMYVKPNWQVNEGNVHHRR